MQKAWSVPLFAVLIFSAGNAMAQASHPPAAHEAEPAAKSKRSDYRQAVAKFFQQRSQLQQQAKAAFDHEMARQKAGDCPHARSTYDENICLGKAIHATLANYQSFSGALCSLLGQKNPMMDASTRDMIGPTGKPLTAEQMTKEFDQVEAEWERYRKAQCSAAYDLFKGGTIAPSMGGLCELKLIRSRMADLNYIYDMTLHH
ncbi:MAG TPA: lysozyme inhibitor LprI family protein [Terriglobia bacterium]|nr:lysozyme inhibitor LprI family protein [Terriglobia bacterium]